VCRGAAWPRRLWVATLDIDALEQVVQLTLFNRDDARAIDRFRELEPSSIQALM
jgi:hypothetical protein